MARIRTIKPEFWQNETLAELPALTRLLAIGLLNYADDEGFFKATPALIRASIFPFDDSANILGMLQELSSAGYIRLTDGSDGRSYGCIPTFLKHQRVDKPKQSEIKALCEFQDASKNIPRSVQEASVLEGKGKEEEGEQGKEQGVGAAAPPAPRADSSRGSRLPTDWVLPDDWRDWTTIEFPQIHANNESLKFRDYWLAKSGADGRKADWFATWRNWIRRAAERTVPTQSKQRHNDFDNRDYTTGVTSDGGF